MRKLSFTLFVIALLLFPGRARGQNGEVESEEYAVYSAVISRMLEKHVAPPVKLILIKDQTAIYGSKLTRPDWKLRPQGIYGVTKDTLDDYVARNDQPQRLEKLFDLKVKYELVDESEHRKWRAELGRHGNDTLGIFYFSRVGFNRGKTQALLYREMRTPSGEADHVLLVKEKGVWKVAREQAWWIE